MTLQHAGISLHTARASAEEAAHSMWQEVSVFLTSIGARAVGHGMCLPPSHLTTTTTVAPMEQTM